MLIALGISFITHPVGYPIILAIYLAYTFIGKAIEKIAFKKSEDKDEKKEFYFFPKYIESTGDIIWFEWSVWLWRPISSPKYIYAGKPQIKNFN